MIKEEIRDCQTYITPIEQNTIEDMIKVLGHVTYDLSHGGFQISENKATYIYALQQVRTNLSELNNRWIDRMKQLVFEDVIKEVRKEKEMETNSAN